MSYWLNQIFIYILFMLLNPLTYWFLFLVFLSSYRRRAQERRFFGTKVTPYLSEWKGTIMITIIFSVILSIISITFPLILTREIIIGIVFLFILFSINGTFTLLSSVYTIGITFILFLIIPYILPDSYYFQTFDWVTKEHFNSLAILLSVLLLAEVMLLLIARNHLSYPRLIKSNRGKWIGIQQLKKIVFIPFLMYIPTEWVEGIITYIPFIFTPEADYQLIIFPLFVGYQLHVKATLPNKIAIQLAKQLIYIAIVIIVLINVSFTYAFISFVAILIAILGREFIVYWNRMKDSGNRLLFGQEAVGMKVLGILPGSPAERIGITIGETIVKVNGEDIRTKREFYEALQNSGAFFKLYIEDTNGEMRFITSAFHEEDHFGLGIVFPDKPYRK